MPFSYFCVLLEVLQLFNLYSFVSADIYWNRSCFNSNRGSATKLLSSHCILPLHRHTVIKKQMNTNIMSVSHRNHFDDEGKNWGCMILWLNCGSYLYVFDTNPFSDIWFAKISSHSVGCFSTFLKHRSFKFWWYSMYLFFFCCLACVLYT